MQIVLVTGYLPLYFSANGGSAAIPEDGPPVGPPFMDFPPLLRKSGPPDSPSESSLTSAEDLENRRLEKKMEFEKIKDHYPPDIRFNLLNIREV